MNDMNWDDCRYFLAAAETGSFSAAAKLLQSNQPTVGRHIDALETSLGIKLFQRHTQGLTLTDEGLSIVDECLQMQSKAIKIQRSLNGKEHHTEGVVKLAVPEGISTGLLIPNLSVFYKKFPDIKLELQVSSQTADLTRGEADIAIRLFRPRQADLVIKKLMDMTISLYGTKKYTRKHGLISRIQDIKQHKIIAYGFGLYDLAENQWLLDHSNVENVILKTDSTFSRLQATEAGLAVSLQPDLLVNSNSKLIKLISNKQIPQHQVWLVYHNDVRHLGRIRAVVEFIIQLFDDSK